VLSDPRWLNRFRTQHRLAAAFRKERVFLAGDTAHVHVPVGGQGMNYGIQDAFNLAWKLAGVARGELSPWILETYEMERRPAAAELVEATERVFHAVAPAGGAGHVRQTLLPLVAGAALHLDHVQQLARDLMAEFNVHYRESPLSETHGGGHLIAGERVPDVRIVRADRATTSLDALLRQRGWLLLALDGRRPLDAKLLDACAAALPPHLQLLRVHTAAPSAASPPDPADLFDVDETLHDTLGVKHPALYLLRPDGYIGFCADLDRRAPDRLRGFLQRVMRTPPPLTASPE
jgi:hypothetical protein